MNRKLAIRNLVWPVLAVLSAVMLAVAIATPRTVRDTSLAARKVQRRIERRMDRLDYLVAHPGARLPEDMVIYTYSADTLQSWRGQFPVFNDEIGSRVFVQRLTNPRVNLRSPLSFATERPTFMNVGAKWFILKAYEQEDKKIVAGLMVMNSMDNSTFNGVNPKLRLGLRFSIRPLTFSEGSPVFVGGKPVFKVMSDSLTRTVSANPSMMWIALLLFVLAAVMFVFRRRTIRRALVAIAAIIVAITAMYFWGYSTQTEYTIFSPVLYAGSSFLFSLGAVLLLNLAIMLCVLNLYLVRKRIWARVKSASTAAVLSVAALAAVLLIAVYTHFTISNIISNSNISLELYKLGSLSVFTLLVYVSFMSMLTSVPMLLQMLQPAVSRLSGVHYDMFSRTSRTVFSVIIASYMVLATAVMGFEKEEDRMEVWAGKLAVDRDITLELRLLNIERAIAADAVISGLSTIDGSEVIIRNRLIDNYLLNESQDYSINVLMLRPGSAPQALTDHFEDAVKSGTPIAEGSAFMSTATDEGPCRYCGVFTYYGSKGVTYMLLEVERKNLLAGKAYSRLLNYSVHGRTTLPPAYSCSRYQGRELRMFRGEFPYSTIMDDWMFETVYTEKACHYNRDGYVHYVNVITDDESVIISRREIGVFSYVMAAVFLALLMFVMLWCLIPRRHQKAPNRHSLRSRISMTLMASLILALVVMATVSVIFVYRRNEANRHSIMSGRINSIQLLAQTGTRSLTGPDMLRSSEFASAIQSVSDNTGSDISVYATGGRIVLCTNPEALDRMLVGYRIEPEALDKIMRLNKRYCIIRKNTGWRHYYNMYMPLIGSDGRISAIICSPYVEENYDFERDAVMHSMSIITVFLLLFILAGLVESTVLDRVFRPLNMIRRTMKRAGQGGLEHIKYDRNDEISTLVETYNRMVDELSESTRQLALAERDKAWSSMARQVAHEIRNPLTPMQLQIQRLIRLKDKGDPSWQDKFDEAAKVLLEHIDILNETSNEFSTFARLYTEEPVSIDLDKLLQKEVAMYDNRDDVTFSYIGLSGATISGPRPQLTRVFVNLLNNAVQAVEGQEDARVYVALRKSSETEGYYDIVVEDNGPGVSEDNISRLFTPKFTTKNGGSGLGLAICRNVLEKCGASISYSRSFTLGGACFTIRYPAS